MPAFSNPTSFFTPFPKDDVNNLRLNSINWGYYFNVKHSSNGFTIEPGLTINSYVRKHIGTKNELFKYENVGEKFEVTTFTKVSYKLGLDWIIEGDYQFRFTSLHYRNEWENFGSKLYEHNFHNFSFGLSYRRSDTFKPYISFAQSSREPSRTNLFGSNDNPTSLTDIINVKPETVRDLEVGTKIISKKLNGSFNGYYMYFKDEIISIGQLNSMGIALGTNADKSYRLGVEGDLTLKLKKLEVGSSFNFSKNKVWLNDTKSEPVLTPNFTSNLFTNYKLGKFEVGANYKYVTQSFLDNDNSFTCPEYHLIDTNICYNFRNNTSVKLFINNILNKNWTTGGSLGHDYDSSWNPTSTYRQFYYTSGTNFYVTFNYKF
jgi:iron complex outermembrane receptor protein